MELAEARRLVRDAVSSAEARTAEAGGRLLAADRSLVTRLPGWVSRFSLLTDARGWWLVVFRRPGVRALESGSGQFVMDCPAGRYFVDLFDPRAREWVARESAAGGPLVAGLLCPGPAVVARIRRAAGQLR